jgi:cell division protein FtsB
MIVMRALRRRAGVVVGPLFGIALTGYFACNLVEGDRGFLAWTRLTQQISAENARLEALRAERAAIRQKVSELTPDHLDPDLLDERVRVILNLAASNERVIMKPAANVPSAPQPLSGNASSGLPDR